MYGSNLYKLSCEENKGTAGRVKIKDNIFHKNSNYLTFIRVHPYLCAYLPKNKTCIIK